MAVGTIINAQVNLGDTECDLCGTYKHVTCKCVNCDETLCEQCKTAHHRSKATRHHVILELKDVSPQGPGFGVFCQYHPKEVMNMYCTTCGYLICLDCIRGDHRHHEFDKITDVIENKEKEVKYMVHKIKQKKIPNLTQTLQSLLETETNYDQETDHVMADITSKAQELKQEIDQIRDKLIRDLETRRQEDQKYLKERKMKIEEQLSKMRQLVTESEEKMTNLTDLRIFQKLDDIKHTISTMRKSMHDIPEVIPPVFVPGPNEQQQLKQMYGHIVNTSKVSPEKKPDINVSIVSLFTYKSDPCTMQTINPNEVLIGASEGTDIGIVNRKGEVTKTLQNSHEIYRIDVTQSGDILATTCNGNLINRITRRGDVSVFADMSPYITYGIHVTKDGDILAGLSKDSTGRLVKLSTTGQVKQVIEYDENKSILHVDPSYITQNINGDIWVSDTCWRNPRVTMVDGNGRYMFTYRGPTHAKMDKKFNPCDIEHNQYGHILVVDYNNSNIHFLDKNGRFLQFILTQQAGIPNPTALSVDVGGQLWIGCNNGQVVIVKYMSQT